MKDKKAAEAAKKENKKTKTPPATEIKGAVKKSKKKSAAKKAPPAKNKAKGEAAPVKKAKKSKKPEWEEIKTEYILGDISYQKLAVKHKVSINTLKGRAKREKWGELRAASRQKVQKKKQEKLENKLADEAASERLDVLSVANDLLEKVNDRMQCYLDAKDIKALSGALKDIKEVLSTDDDDARRVLIIKIEGDSSKWER